MRERIISIFVGFVLFSISGIFFKILMDETFSWLGIFLVSFLQSLGIVLLVPLIVRLGQKIGWIRKE